MNLDYLNRDYNDMKAAIEELSDVMGVLDSTKIQIILSVLDEWSNLDPIIREMVDKEDK